MLNNISIDVIAKTIAKDHIGLDESGVRLRAESFKNEVNGELEECVKDYVENDNMTEYVYGDFSLGEIMGIRRCGYMEAIRLMSIYMDDNKQGEFEILMPSFARHYIPEGEE